MTAQKSWTENKSLYSTVAKLWKRQRRFSKLAAGFHGVVFKVLQQLSKYFYCYPVGWFCNMFRWSENLVFLCLKREHHLLFTNLWQIFLKIFFVSRIRAIIVYQCFAIKARIVSSIKNSCQSLFMKWSRFSRTYLRFTSVCFVNTFFFPGWHKKSGHHQKSNNFQILFGLTQNFSYIRSSLCSRHLQSFKSVLQKLFVSLTLKKCAPNELPGAAGTFGYGGQSSRWPSCIPPLGSLLLLLWLLPSGQG